MIFGYQDYEGNELERRKILKLTKKQTPLRKTIKKYSYISINELYQHIYDDKDLHLGVKITKFPIETFCALCIMSSNDYFDNIPKVQFKTIIEVFSSNPLKYKQMITTKINKNRTSINNMKFYNIPIEYGVNFEVFSTFIIDCMKKNMSKCKDCNTYEELRNCALNNYKFKDDYFPTLNRLRSSAANLSWCLAYFGNGSIHSDIHVVKNPLSVNSDRESCFGWEFKDIYEKATISNVKFSDDVEKKDIYWCL